MPGSVTHIILTFSVTFLTPKSGLEVNDWSYVLIFTVFTKNQGDDTTAVTRQIVSDILKPTSNLHLTDNFCGYHIYYRMLYNFYYS